MADRTPVRITAQSFPTPEVVKTTNNPAQWDQAGGFAAVQADEANHALALLDARLATASTFGERVAAFESACRHVADWRYQVAAQGRWTRPASSAQDFRQPFPGQRRYRLSPSTGTRERGSPGFRMLTELERIALDRFDGSEDRVQNLVRLRDGRTVDGNLLVRGRGAVDWGLGAKDVIAVTATAEDRELLRRAAFETLARLETRRAEAGHLDAHDPRHRQAFADAAYFLIQAPEFKRGTDAVMRTFLVAAHTRVFAAAPVLPQGIDLDGIVRGQDGFSKVMHEQLRVIPPSAGQVQARSPDALSADRGGRRAYTTRRSAETER